MIVIKEKIKGITLTTIFLIFLLSLMSGCIDSVDSNNGEDFEFTLLDGTIKYLSDYYGKVIVIDFMGVDCGYCFPQMFELKKISENYSNDDVTIISIDVWVIRGETAGYLQSYIDYFKNEYNTELDWIFGLDDTSGTIFYKYANEGVPALYILDQNGNIYYTNIGLAPYETLSPKIEELLS